MKVILATLVVLFCGRSFAQNVGINETGGAPDPSAVLHVESESDTKGMLIPRLTTSQRDAILTPADGLMIYNLDTKCINTFTGLVWRDYCSAVSQTCPSGMVSFGYFSMEQITHPATTFYPAVVICKNLSLRTRLPTAAEWYVACQSGLILSMGSNDEWVDDFIHEDNILIIGGTACDDTSVGHESIPRVFRCVCEH